MQHCQSASEAHTSSPKPLLCFSAGGRECSSPSEHVHVDAAATVSEKLFPTSLTFESIQSHFCHSYTLSGRKKSFTLRLQTLWLSFKSLLFAAFSKPGGSVVKNLPANARRCSRCQFNSRVREILWRRKRQPAPVF